MKAFAPSKKSPCHSCGDVAIYLFYLLLTDLLTEGQSDTDFAPGTNRYYRKAQLPAPDDEDTSPDNQSLWSAMSDQSAGLSATTSETILDISK